jgi:tetratricopeptide (TPR) repeat protein
VALVVLSMAPLSMTPVLCAPSDPQWSELRSPHFELITDAGERYGPGLLLHLENLRRLFLTQTSGEEPRAALRVRVIAFRSAAEYARYRLDDAADAYYVGEDGHDTIVMPLTGTADYRTAAHEYAHAAIRASGRKLPLWLTEGIAEVFSTVRFQGGDAVLGNPNPGRVQALERGRWIPLIELMDMTGTPGGGHERTSMFYAESWALTHLLMFSPAYSPRMGALLDRLGGGTSGARVIGDVHGKPPAALEQDVRAWLARPGLPSVTVAPPGSEPRLAPAFVPLAARDAERILAELLLATGKLESARVAYARLETQSPSDADIQAALGRLAIRSGGRSEALERFGRALALGIRNARLCYEYAVMAKEADFPEADVVAALERAVALDPGLDDARYLLALAHLNAGRYRLTLQHFQALRHVPLSRGFAYYSALSYIQNELGMRAEAEQSAVEARAYAHNQDEAEHARELAWMAQSEIVVQMTADRQGRLRRIPKEPGAVENWNPFIEPGDRIERRQGDLREVECTAAGLRLVLSVDNRPLVLNVTYPERVQLRQGAAGALEFTCGKQNGPRVIVEFAAAPDPQAGAAGVVRGIEFLK